ncbi:MAG: TetR/AcrR family transcriptional regulator [Sedimentibacter sp.]
MATREGNNREQEFIDAALELFYQKGIEETTVNNIIDKVGLTKGAFYHYFDSKESIYKAASKYYVDKKVEVVKGITKEQNIDAIEKLNRINSEIVNIKLNNADFRWKIYKVISSNKNIKIDKLIKEQFLIEAKPYYTNIILQGIQEGTINTRFPEETAEFLIHLNNLINKMITDSIFGDETLLESMEVIIKKMADPQNQLIIMRKLEFYEDTLVRILGTKEGDIDFAEFIINKLRELYGNYEGGE